MRSDNVLIPLADEDWLDEKRSILDPKLHFFRMFATLWSYDRTTQLRPKHQLPARRVSGTFRGENGQSSRQIRVGQSFGE